MKLTLLILLSISFAGCAVRTIRDGQNKTTTSEKNRNPSSFVENGFYKGDMMVAGDFQLIGFGGDYTPKAGRVMLILQNPGIDGGITGLFNGEKRFILRDQDHEFLFIIPKDLQHDDGVISVHKSSAKQTAHLVITKKRNFIKASEEKAIEKCGIIGAKEVLYTVNQYNMKLHVRIYNELGSAEIHSDEFIERERVFAKDLSDCL
jgi:hypothetical protein